MGQLCGAFDYIEPDDVKDVFVNGIAKVEGLGDGQFVRVWLYTDECLAVRCRVIRVKLVLPLQRAIEMNDEAGGTFRTIHRERHPLRLV